MLTSKQFKRGQKAIAKALKKSIQTVNEKLNIVLAQLNHQNANPETFDEILTKINEDNWFFRKDLVQILNKLKADGYVTEENNTFYLSFEGKKFIEEGGYVKKSKWEKLNTAWKIIKIWGGIISGIILLYLAIMTYIKENKIVNLEKNIIEKDSTVHRLESKLDSIKKVQANDSIAKIKATDSIAEIYFSEFMIVELPRPNSGTFSYEEAKKRMPEIYNLQTTQKYFNWKKGAAVHINKKDEIEVYGFPLRLINQNRNDTAVIIVKDSMDLLHYVENPVAMGNPSFVLITSEINLHKSKAIKKIMEELWMPGVQLYYLVRKK